MKEKLRRIAERTRGIWDVHKVPICLMAGVVIGTASTYVTYRLAAETTAKATAEGITKALLELGEAVNQNKVVETTIVEV